MLVAGFKARFRKIYQAYLLWNRHEGKLNFLIFRLICRIYLEKNFRDWFGNKKGS
jgi:hypothetical protein